MAEIIKPPNRILRLDQSNRFGRNVVFASLPGQMPGMDLRARQDPVVTSPTYGFGPYGANVLYASTGGSVFSGLKPIPKTQDGFTSVVIAAPPAQARMNALLFLGDESGSPFIQSTLAANYDTSIDGVRSGYLSYFEYTGVFSAKRACAPGVIDGQPHVFILVRNPGAAAPDIYIDGVASTGASTVGGTVSLPAGVGVGSTNKLSNSRSCAGPLYLAYVLDRAISASEVIKLVRNPYQIFDSEQRILVGVAGVGPFPFSADLTAAALGFTPNAVARFTDYVAALTSAAFSFTANALTQFVGYVAGLTSAVFSFTPNAVTRLADYVAGLTSAAFGFTANAVTQLISYVAGLTSAAFGFAAQATVTTSNFKAQITAASLRFVAREVDAAIAGFEVVTAWVTLMRRGRGRH